MQHTDGTFISLVPPSWIRDYLDEMHAAKNEMPMAFHFLSACVVIGQMLGLETWATLAKGVKIFPNVNALLLSPAGKCRRGEGTKITINIARRAGVHILEGRTTPEALLDELIENGNTLLYVEELSMLLTKQEFQRPIVPFLTKLLLHGRGMSEMRTRGAGKKEVPHINLSALFTSAPDWFMSTIPDEAFGGGMMSRFLVCCLDERDTFHIDIQADDSKSDAILHRLAGGLDPIRNWNKGRMLGTDDAQSWIEKWYMLNETEAVSDDRMSPHRNRKPANLLRLAMILSAASDEERITRDVLESSLELLNWFEPTLARLYGITEEVVSYMGRGEKRIVTKLGSVNQNILPHSDLARSCLSYFRGGARDMRRCLEGLLEKGLIEAQYRNGTHHYPPKTWKLNNIKVP